ncbi:hypothetical protein [Halomonas denitrificans]|nr:hypothetical protein [Halomonas denitrificans]
MTHPADAAPKTPQASGGRPQRELRRREGFRLLRRMLAYHAIVAVVLVIGLVAYPPLVELLPVGGVEELAESGPWSVERPSPEPAVTEGEIVRTVLDATGELDRLGYARRLAIALVGLWILMLPVAWVHKRMYRAQTFDHSLDETTLVLPGVVAAIVLVVQHSLALAFSLAGIVAGVQFRRALQDTFDALFILVAIGAGIAAGVEALEIAAVLSVFFSYATLYVCCFGDGLESDFVARRKREKRARKAAIQRAEQERATGGDDDPRHDTGG